MNKNEIINKINSFEDFKKEKNLIFGKEGVISKLKDKMKLLPKDETQEIWKEINDIKVEANVIFGLAMEKLNNINIEKKLKSEWIDLTIPLNNFSSLHPISKIINLMNEWFIQNGYYNFLSDEVDTIEYNFEKLNIPKNHPSLNMHDTFYINGSTLMRTHNTASSVKMLEVMQNTPFSAYTIGKVYRKDTDDATHSHQFFQCDFISTGDHSFANLKWTLNSLINHIFEKEIEIRIRPSYFPFTEPSLELDIYHNDKWIEVLGAGMLHKNIFKLVGINENIRGFAAGIGIERIAMIKYNILDIRELYNNDLRFLDQFKGVL